jgi:hypothetical protein
MPRRSEHAALIAQLAPAEQWRVIGRSVVSRSLAGKKNAPILPNEIASATLNKYGPETKAAVVLVGGNRLFADVSAAIIHTLGKHLRAEVAEGLAPQLKLVAWARLVHDAYVSQPALFAAVMQARIIQRALTTGWGQGILPPELAVPARCEVGAPELRTTNRKDDPFTPCKVPMVDDTLPLLDLPLIGEGGDEQDIGILLEDHVNRWIKHLLQVGVGHEPGVVWVIEQDAGHRMVEVYYPWLTAVHAFVSEVALAAGTLDQQPDDVKIPVIPTTEELRDAGTLEKRAVILGIIAVLRYVREYACTTRSTEEGSTAALTRLAELAIDILGPRDPVTIETVACETMARIRTYRETSPGLFEDAIKDLRNSVQSLEDVILDGSYSAGSAAEVLTAACVAINTVRREKSSRHQDDDDLVTLLKGLWARFFDLLGFGDMEKTANDTDEYTQSRQKKLYYHLHNYAGFLAGLGEDEESLREAIRLYNDYVLPARAKVAEHRRIFKPYRIALQVCSRAEVNLADLLREAGRIEESVETLRSAMNRSMIIRRDKDTIPMLVNEKRGYNQSSLNTALTIARIEIRAFEWRVTQPRGEAVELLDKILRRAHDWIDAQGTQPLVTLRRAELKDLVKRFAAVSHKSSVHIKAVRT